MGIVRGDVAKAAAKSQSFVNTDDATVIDARAGSIVIDDPALLTHGDYMRLGPDLMIVGPDGQTVLLTDYFAMQSPPDLAGPGSMAISADLATKLAGPRAPGQVAQAGDQIAQTAEAIGTVTRLDGEVFATRADGTRVRLQSGDEVFQGDVLETGADGAIGITFVDNTEMSLGGDGRMVLDEMIYDPDGGDGSSQFSLVSGVFSFVSGQIAKSGPDAMQVNTPVATIGIRGTKGIIKIQTIDTDGDGEADTRMEVALLDSGEIVVSTFQGSTQVLNKVFTGFRVVNISGRDVLTGPSQEETQSFDVTRDYFDDGGVNTALRFLPSQNQNDQPPEKQQAPEPEKPVLDPDLTPDGPTLNQNLAEQIIKVVLDPKVLHQIITGKPPEPGAQSPVTPITVKTGDENTGTGAGDGGQQDDDDRRDDESLTDAPPVVETPELEVRVNGTLDRSESTLPLRVFGGSGSDFVQTGSGGDVVYGGAGGDRIQTNAGDDTVYGGAGADTIVGGSGRGDDVYFGGDGPDSDDSADDQLVYTSAAQGVYVDLALGYATGPDVDYDRIYGMEHVISAGGNDVLIGNGAANRLEAGGGNDLLIGGGGNDTLRGGTGDDVYAYTAPGWGQDIIDDAGGTDTLDLTQVAGREPTGLMLADADNDGAVDDLVFEYEDGSRQTIVNHTGSGRLEQVRVADDHDGSVDDYIIRDGGAATSGHDLLYGTAGADTLGGGAGDDVLFGNAGDDTLLIEGGDDVALGGTGNDTYHLIGAFGDADIQDAGGSDTLRFETSIMGSYYTFPLDAEIRPDGDMHLRYANGSEVWVANQGQGLGIETYTEVYGYEGQTSTSTYAVRTAAQGATAGNDFLVGSGAAENLSGGDGDDMVAGGGGDDTLTAGAGHDLLLGGFGNDTYRAPAGSVAEIYDVSGFDTLDMSGDTLVSGNWQGGMNLSLSFASGAHVYIYGQGHADSRIETIKLTDGTYALASGPSGSAGNDVLVAGYGVSSLYGNGGNDVLQANAATDSVDLHGGDGDDSLVGGAYNDTLTGGAGNDSLRGGGGNDVIVGGAGDDTVLDFRQSGADVIDVSALDLTDYASVVSAAADNGGDLVITHADGTLRLKGQQTANMEEGWFTGLTTPNSAPVISVIKELYSTDFETDPATQGWTLASDWQWGPPGGDPDATGTPDGSANVIGTVLGGPYSSGLDGAPAFATLAPIALDGSSNYRLAFDRWLSTEGGYDTAVVEIQADGGSWQEVWNSDTASDTTGVDFDGYGATWTRQTVDLSAHLAGASTVAVRWGQYSDGGVQYGGWTLDNVALQSTNGTFADLTLGTVPNTAVASPPDTLVSTLTATATDADDDTLGIAITDLPTPEGSGTWAYSLDDGLTWAPIDETQVSETNALLLTDTARLRFESSGSASGYKMTMSFRAWDQSTGTAGTYADTTTSGGTTAFSTAAATADLTVLPPNTAPSFNQTSYTDTSIKQYSEIIVYSSELDFAADNGDGDPPAQPLPGQDGNTGTVSDADGPLSAGTGYAIVGASGPGTWEYTTDGGATWSALSVSATSALLLTTDYGHRLRYTPADPSDDTEDPSLTYKAWDGADGRSSGDTNVDTTLANNNAYSADTATYTVDIANVPDWIGGTAGFDATVASGQWDTGVLPGSTDTAHFLSNSAETLTFDTGDSLSTGGFRLHGDATLALSGGTLTLANDLDADSGTTLRIDGGSLIQAPRSYGSDFNISGGMTFSSGTLRAGSGYTELQYSGSTPLAFHDGTSGTPLLEGMSIEIMSGSSAELLNTTLTADSSQDASSAWFSGRMEVSGTLSVLGGTNTLGSDNPNFALGIGDTYSSGRSGLVEIQAGGTPTKLLTNSITNAGTIRFIGDAPTDQAELAELAYSPTLYNRGGLIEVTGTAGTHAILGITVNHTQNYDGTSTGLIAVATGTTLAFATGYTMTVDSNAGFDIDGTLDNDGTIDFQSNSTLAGTGTLINDGTITIGAGYTLSVTEGASIINNGALSGGAGATIDLDPDGDGQNVGTFTENGTTTDVSFGNSPGVFTIDGHYTEGNEAAGYLYEVGGTAAGTGYDQLVVTGTYTMGGTLRVTDWAGFTPAADDSFHIIDAGAVAGRLSHAEGLDTWVDQGIMMDARVAADGVHLDARAVTQRAGDAGETLVASAGAGDVLVGGAGSDIFHAGGGRDLLVGGDGDDVFVVQDAAFGRIDGGAGFDTLRVNGTVDLRIGGERLDGLERLQLGDGASRVTLDAASVRSATEVGPGRSLVVDGASDDTLALDGGWNHQADADGYSLYASNDGDVTVQVAQAVQVELAAA